MKKSLKICLIAWISILLIWWILVWLTRNWTIIIDHSKELSAKNSRMSKDIENSLTYEEAVNKWLIYEDERKSRHIDCWEYWYFSCEHWCVPNDLHYERARWFDENWDLSLEIGHEQFCKKNYIQYLQANNLLNTKKHGNNNRNGDNLNHEDIHDNQKNSDCFYDCSEGEDEDECAYYCLSETN